MVMPAAQAYHRLGCWQASGLLGSLRMTDVFMGCETRPSHGVHQKAASCALAMRRSRTRTTQARLSSPGYPKESTAVRDNVGYH